jgi:hypothetical protein
MKHNVYYYILHIYITLVPDAESLLRHPRNRRAKSQPEARTKKTTKNKNKQHSKVSALVNQAYKVAKSSLFQNMCLRYMRNVQTRPIEGKETY